MNWLRKLAGLKPYWNETHKIYEDKLDITEQTIMSYCRSDDKHIDDDIEKNEENLWSTSTTYDTEDNTMVNEIDCSNEKTVRARAFQIAATYGNNVDIGDEKKEWKPVNIIGQIRIAKNIFDWIWSGITLNIDETQKETEDKDSPIEENQEHKDNTND